MKWQGGMWIRPQNYETNSAYVTMTYGQYIWKANTSNVNVIGNYRAESIYDPDEALGGHQPAGYTRAAGRYNYYHVYKCHCSLQIIGASITTAPLFLEAVMCRSDEAYAYVNMYRAIEARNQHIKYLILPIGGSGGAYKRLSLWWRESRDSMYPHNEDMTAFGNNPGENATFNIAFQDMTGTGGTDDAVTCFIRLKYYVRVSGLKAPQAN